MNTHRVFSVFMLYKLVCKLIGAATITPEWDAQSQGVAAGTSPGRERPLSSVTPETKPSTARTRKTAAWESRFIGDDLASSFSGWLDLYRPASS